MDREQIEQILTSRGYADYKWLNPQEDILVAQWVRFHCMFGCPDYGKFGSCPPAVPSVGECRQMIKEYQTALILHFNLPSYTDEEKRRLMKGLLSLERDIFLAGYYKVFLMPHSSCDLCRECAARGERINCVNTAKSRPSPDAMGIDVFQTARKAGYSLEVLKKPGEASNRFSFLLIE